MTFSLHKEISHKGEGDNINFCNNVMAENATLQNNVLLVIHFAVLNSEFIS